MSDEVGFAVTPEPDMLQTPTSGSVGAGQESHAAQRRAATPFPPEPPMADPEPM